ncbi:E3 ubiquitin-protein ligase rad18 [Pseudogymnoascus destructans]|uniref:Postreplication repair E3 ubiquitin-protein ligase RAD18 n=1 Tax=Pseudogymnoascus destructans TaxID=655981 RepID=A0A177A8U2_9PEZI|nr:E3 ubiquitin-protein ligase rad18 [Pseudogymnoascus destructans]OAF57651.1 E3 ubiquitin-protein ligase rad18 [Pseudogymnoascus destructans]
MATIGPQDTTFDVPDPTDWKGTALQGFAAVESPMRCQVCKEFMTTPMMTSCGHTFCSLCIRRCLANDGLCPACRTPDQELKLRANKCMGEVIESFKQIRGPALEIARMPPVLSDPVSQKRKRDASISNSQDLEKRRTRSSTRIASQEPLESPMEATYIEQSDGASAPPSDHSSSKPNNISNPSITTNFRLQRPTFEPTPLPTLNYSLLSDTNLRKKLKDLGISSIGNRPPLERRHREWVTLWNANCDSSKPRSKAELLRDLETWERTQVSQGTSRNYTGGGLPIASKDFDGAAWSSKHGPTFRSLIEEAARSRRQKSSGEATSTSEPIGVTIDVSGDNFSEETNDCAD